jgi:hypothetical protein
MLNNFLRKASAFAKGKYSDIIGGLKKIPQSLKKPEVQKSILKIILILITLLILILLILWIIKMLLAMLANLMDIYGIYITVIVLVILWLWNWKEGKKKETQKRRTEERQKELMTYKRDAVANYNYLKNFLYRILYNQHFCDLAELIKPLTINNINENPPFYIDDKTHTVFYYFRADKKSVEPLEKGVDNIVNLLQSVITNKVETVGIEGICPPARDNLTSVIAVHEVVDCGSYVRIALVFDNNAYREAVQSRQLAIKPLLPEDKYLK